MTYLPRFARVLAFASVHMLTPAWGQAQDAPMTRTNLAEAQPATAALAKADLMKTNVAMIEIAKGELKSGDRLMAEATPPAPSHSGPPDRCDGPPPGPGPKFHAGEAPRPNFGPGRLAARLNAAETEIGIRSNQLDAWRDFTDALIGTMTPPWLQASGQAGAPGAAPGAQANQPFARAERLADNMIERGRHAEDLKKAIETLKGKLTPEQLIKVADIEARLGARQGAPGPHFGPPHHGPGPQPDAGPGGPDGDETPPPTPSEQ